MPEERIHTHLIRERITDGVRLVFIMQRVIGNPNWTAAVSDDEVEVAGVRGVVRRLTRRCLYKGFWSIQGPVLELRWVLQVPLDGTVRLFDGRRRAAA